MNDAKADFLEFIIIFVTALFVVPIINFFGGYVVFLVWNKILVDVVTILAPITYWKAYFLTLAISFPLTVSKVYRDHKNNKL
jgi:hypothetical protein